MKKNQSALPVGGLSKPIFPFLCLITCTTVFGMAEANAQQDPFAGLKAVAAKQAVLNSSDASKAIITTSNPKWQALSQPAKVFKPLTLIDKDGKPIPPNTPVTLANKKTVSAQQFVDAYNKVELIVTKQGYSLREGKDIVLSRLVTPQGEIDRQINAMPKAIAPLRDEKSINEFMSTSRQVGGVQLKLTKDYTDAEKKKLATVVFDVQNGKVTSKTLQKTGQAIFIPNTLLPPPKLIDDTRSEDWVIGDPEIFQVGVHGELARHAIIYPLDLQHQMTSKSSFELDAKGKVFGSVVNHSADLLNASVDIVSPADSSKKMTARVVLSLAGFSILNINESYAQAKTFRDSIARRAAKSVNAQFPLGLGFTFDGTLNVDGMVGMEYGYALDKLTAFMYARPVAELDGSGQASVEFLEIFGGGVEGELTFMHGKLDLNAWVGIWTQDASQIVVADSYYFGYDLTLLKGKLDAFFSVCFPIPFGSQLCKQVKTSIYDGPGYHSSGTIAEGQNVYFINF